MTAFEPELLSCATCGVETAAPLPEICPICADERQYVPASGQAWTSQAEIAARTQTRIEEVGERQWTLHAPGVGIGQTMHAIRTDSGGVLLWDPLGVTQREAVAFVSSLGPVTAIVASHPHMYGAQVSWSRALGGPPVVVAAADAGWVQRPDSAITAVEGTVHLERDAELVTLGGHFPGSMVLHWTSGAQGRGVLLAGDTIMVNPDRATTSFMRSYPNRLPLSGATVERMMATLGDRPYDRIWSNFGNAITQDADEHVAASARRHAAWAGGAFDDQT